MTARQDQIDANVEEMVRLLAGTSGATQLTGDRFRRILRRAQQLIREEETAQDLKSKRHTRQNTQARLRVIAHEPSEQSDPDRFRDIDEHYAEMERGEAPMSTAQK